jgi:hypothetical protein
MPLRPFAVYSPRGCVHIGLHTSHADCWQIALGWPAQEEIDQHKAKGWYCVEGTFSYTNASPMDGGRAQQGDKP